MKWTTKICDIDYSKLKNGQVVNHFNNNQHLTSKFGITRRLRSLPIVYNVDIDRFYPRCFDMGDQN
jgi:tubulin monoglycylase TTLL3/8